jgi:YesN/AraC family two-component response regulator
MASERPFRESELMLADLAVKLNTLPNHLSQLINEREGKSFYDYINTLRIEEFIRLASVPDSRRYSLMGLAQECGFSSKSSFIRYCRKVTGKSPSEFLEGVTAGG